MSFEQIRGNEKIIKRLKESVKSGIVSHAYIFEGDGCADIYLVAETFIKAVLCETNQSGGGIGNSCDKCTSCRKILHGNHEDFIRINTEGNRVKDDDIEQMQARLKKKPLSGSRSAVIIEAADSMTLRAQNRLLKTLEEPPEGAVMILLSDNAENLAQTVRSRCISIRLRPFRTDEEQESFEAARTVENMLLNKRPFYEITKVLEKQVKDAQNFLDALESWYRDICISDFNDRELLFYREFADETASKSRLYKKDDIYRAIACIEAARSDLNRNINISYTLKNLILKIGG